ncbi:hypothetical protein BACCIP111895_04107 [Neobacillus rhizosphaerae]|uniref:DUF5590 domain-containing protein n=1 Tax=Neobacillus rhizosphaerae TaxID=2880965 RepID=A0ABN8KSV5_9BACI|nr:hypothetical protein [Neobacillus rhizosphaerae]CAH2716919.1 hypothetical protein BACCIP111895_04107 [Neobacillus rhizosphaerae]
MYKKILISSAVFAVFAGTVFWFLMQSFPRSFHQKYTDSTDLHTENINGFYLFDNINMDNFISIYGKQMHKSADNDLYNYYEVQDGLEIATTTNGGILRFSVEKSSIPTSKGINVGESITEVKKACGENYYKRTEQGLDIMGFVDKKCHQSIEFWYDQKKVLFYRLDDSRMQ